MTKEIMLNGVIVNFTGSNEELEKLMSLLDDIAITSDAISFYEDNSNLKVTANANSIELDIADMKAGGSALILLSAFDDVSKENALAFARYAINASELGDSILKGKDAYSFDCIAELPNNITINGKTMIPRKSVSWKRAREEPMSIVASKDEIMESKIINAVGNLRIDYCPVYGNVINRTPIGHYYLGEELAIVKKLMVGGRKLYQLKDGMFVDAYNIKLKENGNNED